MNNKALNEQVARKLGTCLKHFLPTTSNEGNESHRHCDVPDYMHSIEAAWEIVEHLNSKETWRREHGHGFHSVEISVFRDGYNDDKVKWTVYVDRGQLGEAARATADTAPMAICLAFLKLQ